jgi:hypothetical protein
MIQHYYSDGKYHYYTTSNKDEAEKFAAYYGGSFEFVNLFETFYKITI